MICEECKKDVPRLRGIYDPELKRVVFRCTPCMTGVNPSLYPTDKRWYEGQGYSFSASPAHIRDIRHRRVAEDGRGVERNYR